MTLNATRGRKYLARAWRAQGGLCGICGLKMRRPPAPCLTSHPLDPSNDHVIAKSIGGKRCFTNVIAAHVRCNTSKRSRPPTGCELIWLAVVRAKLHQDSHPLPSAKQLRQLAGLRREAA